MSDPTSAPAFSKHKSAAQNDGTPAARGGARMSLLARSLIFVCVPSFTGLTGLGISYLQSLRAEKHGVGDGEEEPHAVDFDRDFVTPFLLTMALVVVLGFQTNGFSPNEATHKRGAIVWPKSRTVQRIRRERVVVDDDDEKKER